MTRYRFTRPTTGTKTPHLSGICSPAVLEALREALEARGWSVGAA